MLAITVSAQARPVAKAQPKHTASSRPTGHPLRSVKLALPVTFATGFATLASEARAQESYRMIEAQIAQVADIPTPLLYFGFLTSSLTFAAGTYVVLSKVKLI